MDESADQRDASEFDGDIGFSATIGMDSIPDAVVIADTDSRRIVQMNAAATELFRCDRGALVGRLQTDLHPAGDAEAYIEAFRRGLDDQRVNRLQSGEPLLIETADGTQIPVEITVQTLTDAENTYLMGIFREASDQLARERTLERTTSRLAALLDGLPVPVALIDTDGVVKRWNRAAEDVLGYTAEQIVGQRYGLFTDDEEFDVLLERVLEGDTLQRYQTTLRAENGALVPAEVDACPVYVDGTITGIVGTAVDVSNRNQREQQLDVLHRMARHNLRNELTVIRGWGEMLENGNCHGERAATKIIDASNRLSELSDEVMNIPRVVTTDEQPATPRDISSVLTILSEQLRTNEGVANVELTAHSPAEQIRAKAVRATSKLFGNMIDRDETATIQLELESLDSYTEIVVESNRPLLTGGERMLIQSGTETALQHATGISIARSYLTIQSIGETVALTDSSTDVPATTLAVEVPRVDT